MTNRKNNADFEHPSAPCTFQPSAARWAACADCGHLIAVHKVDPSNFACSTCEVLASLRRIAMLTVDAKPQKDILG